MKISFSGIITLFFLLCVALDPASPQTPPNTVTFDNQSGEFAVVKLVGPSKISVEVPNGQKRTVNVEAGDYYLLGRYGIKPEEYKYTKGDPFEVTQSGRKYSIITITLHKVVDGNYHAERVSGKEFESIGQPNFEKSTQSLGSNKSASLEYAQGEASGEFSENSGFPRKNRDFESIEVLLVIIQESYPGKPEIPPDYLGATEEILLKAGKSIVWDEDAKHDATLRIVADGSALSGKYEDSQYLTGSFLSYSGAKISGYIRLIYLGDEIFRGYFGGRIDPPQSSYGPKMPRQAPYAHAFDVSTFRPTLCEMTSKIWGVAC